MMGTQAKAHRELVSNFISRNYSSTICINSGLPLVFKEATDFTGGPKLINFALLPLPLLSILIDNQKGVIDLLKNQCFCSVFGF